MTTIDDIARKRLGIPTLQARNSDSLDFHNVSVWRIKEALEDAYEGGRASIRQTPVRTLISTLSDLLTELANAADEAANTIDTGGSQNQAVGTILHLEQELPIAVALLNAALGLHRIGGRAGAA